MLNAFHAWLFALLVAAAPPDRLANGETPDARASRYHEIVDSALEVAFDPHERPVFRGAHARAHTAELLLAVAFHESGFARDVDVGPCLKLRDPKTGAVRCDGGASACLMQIKIGAGTTREGWTQADLFADRGKCFRSALDKLRRSELACRALPAPLRLTAYAAGSCAPGVGQLRSRELTGIARRWLERAPAPAPDSAYAPLEVTRNDEPAPGLGLARAR